MPPRRLLLPNAAAGSSKNITPNLLSTTSKIPVPKGCTWASATSNLALAAPAAAAAGALRRPGSGRSRAERDRCRRRVPRGWSRHRSRTRVENVLPVLDCAAASNRAVGGLSIAHAAHAAR